MKITGRDPVVRTVLSQHDHDLRIGELSFDDLQRKVAHGLLHVWVLVAAHLLNLLFVGRLSHLEHQRGLSETKVLRGHVTVQEDVDTWRGGDGHRKMAYKRSGPARNGLLAWY